MEGGSQGIHVRADVDVDVVTQTFLREVHLRKLAGKYIYEVVVTTHSQGSTFERTILRRTHRREVHLRKILARREVHLRGRSRSLSFPSRTSETTLLPW